MKIETLDSRKGIFPFRIKFWIFFPISLLLFVVFAIWLLKLPSRKINDTPISSGANENRKSMTIDVSIDIGFLSSSTVNPTFIEKTNLPDGTELMVSVFGETVNFNGSETAVVMDGKFKTNSFGPSNGFKSGIYSLDVTMPIPRVQNSSVRSIIGENGENLKGSLISQGDLGISAAIHRKFEITNGKIKFSYGSAKEVEKIREIANTLMSNISNLEKKGRSMERLRKSKNINDIKRCGEQMREYQPQSKSFAEEASRLPKNFGFNLEVAANELLLCVSCTDNALEYCDMAHSTLGQAMESFKDER